MCTSDVSKEAKPMLAAILTDLAEALAPGQGHLVKIGPVDFGSKDDTAAPPGGAE